MVKGGILKDNSLKGMTSNDGIMVMLIGTKEEDIATEPAQKPLFMEDMSEAELASAMDMPGGLENLGNACYINVIVYCWKSEPELKNSIVDFASEGFGFEPISGVISAMKDVYSRLDKNNNAHPMLLVTQILSAFPRFAERGEGGRFAQQDANELFLELMTVLKQKLLPIKAENQINTYLSVIDQYFGGSFN
ncbi:ubiquitin carboxyl-terminal hydrolase 14-like [Artemia franciscana]